VRPDAAVAQRAKYAAQQDACSHLSGLSMASDQSQTVAQVILAEPDCVRPQCSPNADQSAIVQWQCSNLMLPQGFGAFEVPSLAIALLDQVVDKQQVDQACVAQQKPLTGMPSHCKSHNAVTADIC